MREYEGGFAPTDAPENAPSEGKRKLSLGEGLKIRETDPCRFVREFLLPRLREELNGHSDTAADKLRTSHVNYYSAKARGNWFSGVCSLLQLIMHSGLLADPSSQSRLLLDIYLYVNKLQKQPVQDVVDVARLDPQIKARIAEADEKLTRVQDFLERRFPS